MAATNLLLKSGVSIQEMNTVRKHLSQVKGGQLARLAHPALLISLILSDVVGRSPGRHSWDPLWGDPPPFKECQEVLDRYGLKDKLLMKSHLEEIKEMLRNTKPGEPIFSQTLSILVGTNMQALKAAANQAEKLGYTSLILSSLIEGDTTEAARFHTALAKEIVIRAVILWFDLLASFPGGETTVVVRGQGKGGRNQEFALAAALDLEGLKGVCLLCGGTDGTDDHRRRWGSDGGWRHGGPGAGERTRSKRVAFGGKQLIPFFPTPR